MLLAPQNEELRKLEAEDPTLAGRVRKAFDLARKRGYKRHVFVELKTGEYIHLESLNADRTGTEAPAGNKKKIFTPKTWFVLLALVAFALFLSMG